jgi:hypothetical protein
MPRAIILAALWLLVSPPPAEANVLCRWIGVCLYLSRGFDITVVEGESGQPLPGVYAWAEWVQYAAHGTNGPLMIQEATSGADGRLTFPAWGPTRGSGAGLDLGSDPAVILFKSGYATLLVQNDVPLGADHLAAYRTFTKTAVPSALQPVRGSVAERVSQLKRLIYPIGLSARVSDDQRTQFRSLYLHRLTIVSDELRSLPASASEVTQFRSTLELTARLLKGDRQ